MRFSEPDVRRWCSRPPTPATPTNGLYGQRRRSPKTRSWLPASSTRRPTSSSTRCWSPRGSAASPTSSAVTAYCLRPTVDLAPGRVSGRSIPTSAGPSSDHSQKAHGWPASGSSDLLRALGAAERAAKALAGLQDRYVNATPSGDTDLIRALRNAATTHRDVTWRCDVIRMQLAGSGHGV